MMKKFKIIEKVFTPKIVPEGDGARVMIDNKINFYKQKD